MNTYDVVVKTARGDMVVNLIVEVDAPVGLLLQAVMSHPQLVPHLASLDANHANSVLIHTPAKLPIPVGLGIYFANGVGITGPIGPAPVATEPAYRGLQLIKDLAALVVYKIDPPQADDIGDTLRTGAAQSEDDDAADRADTRWS